MGSHHQEQVDAWIPGAVAEEEPVLSFHSHYNPTLAHALPLTDSQWAMPVQVVSCTQSIHPRVSTMCTRDPHPPPTQPLQPPHAPRRPNSHSRPLENLSPSLASLLSPSSITSSSSATPEQVSSIVIPSTRFPLLTHFPLPFSLFFFHSILTHVHSSQGRRRWVVWNGVVV